MTVPCDPEAAPEPREDEREILLRLSDILPRVPAHLLKPGPHDASAQLRFSIEELAEKIARGRVSVPLERLASVCPEVFRDSSAFPGEQEIPLPLQKLLEQVGMSGRRPTPPNGTPSAPPPPPPPPQPVAEIGPIVEPSAAPPPPEIPGVPAPHTPRIAKAFSTARQIISLFGRSTPPGEQPAPQKAPIEKPAEAGPVTEIHPQPEAPHESPPVPPPATASDTPAEHATAQDTPIEPQPVARDIPVEPPAPAAPVPPGCISLRLLPIFRLLPSQVLRSGTPMPDQARVALPLSSIDAQLAGGHVEIPLDEFIKALPEDLRPTINPVPDTQVWIPLDEIFQNLPPDHLFYMPPLDSVIEPRPAPTPEAPSAEAIPEPAEPPKPAEPTQDLAGKPDPEPAPEQPVSPPPPPSQEPAPAIDSSSPQAPAGEQTIPETGLPPAPAENVPTPPPAEPVSPAPDASAETPALETSAEPPAPAPAPTPTPLPSSTEATSMPAPQPPSAEPTPAAPDPVPSRAAWMRGFQVPPPRLFSGTAPAAEAPSQPAPVEPPPPPPATPEARRTVDFLASQPGIFAAAAFVQGAVFASADFPRKPDLDALRDFMGAFIDNARDSARRLGWNRVLTLACEQFHLTAAVRDNHFIVALHHDRVLNSVTYDALIAAADELSKTAG